MTLLTVICMLTCIVQESRTLTWQLACRLTVDVLSSGKELWLVRSCSKSTGQSTCKAGGLCSKDAVEE